MVASPSEPESGSVQTQAISVERLSHAYADGRLALDAVSLRVAPGERLGLIGPNGSGKSTLLSVLSTRLRPTPPDSASQAEPGRVRVCGVDPVANPSAVRAKIAVVFQSPSVDVKLTAEENLKYAAMLYGLRGSERKARIEAALDSAGLLDRRKDRVEAFSGGMKRRLEIAKALMHRPAVLLLDEPDTGLDVRALEAVWEQLEAERERHGTTLVLATHRMELAERCDRVAVLHAGRCVACESPVQLRERLPGGALRVEALPESVSFVRDRLAALRPAWPDGGAPRIFGSEVVAYDAAPGELARALSEALADDPGEAHSIARVSYGRSTLHDVFLSMTGEAMQP